MHQQTLCDAIRGRRLVTFTYKTDLQARTVAPYIVYRLANQHIHLGGYSEYNPAKPLERHEWRDFEIDQIRSLSVSDETFALDQSLFDPRDKRYRTGIICHVLQNTN